LLEDRRGLSLQLQKFSARSQYADEQEVRAILWIIDPYAGINRHLDIVNRVHTRPLTPPPDRVLKGHRRKVDLRALVTEIFVTPYAVLELTEAYRH